MSLACLDSPASEISLTGTACCGLTELNILSMALELMLSLLILLSCLKIYFLLITFKYMLMYITKGCAETLTPNKMTDKVVAPKSVDAVTAALGSSISELRGRHSQCQMVPRLPRSPDLTFLSLTKDTVCNYFFYFVTGSCEKLIFYAGGVKI